MAHYHDDERWCVLDLLPLFAVAQVILLLLRGFWLKFSWWWVLAPLWGLPLLLVLLAVALVLLTWWQERS